jgi:hypothetical protein
MMVRASWFGSLMVMTIIGSLGITGCSRFMVQDSARTSSTDSQADAAAKHASGCPGTGYHGRLQRDLTQPYSNRQYLLDNGTLCRPQP